MTAVRARRLATVVAGAAVLLAVPATAALAQVPPVPSEVPTDPACVTDPSACASSEPSSDPTSEPSSDPTSEPTSAPSSPPTEPTPAPTVEPSPTEQPSTVTTFDPIIILPPPATAPPPDPGPGPEVAPPPTPEVTSSGGSAGLAPLLFVTDPQLSSSLTGTLVIVLLSALLGVAAFTGTTSLTRRGLLVARDLEGGTDVETTRRYRTMAGVALFALAAIVGMAGFVKIAGETLVPIQVVYLASTGLAVILLAAIGGALLVSEQLRADESRLSEIERSLAILASHAAAGVADAPRLLDRSGQAEAEDVPEDAAGVAAGVERAKPAAKAAAKPAAKPKPRARKPRA